MMQSTTSKSTTNKNNQDSITAEKIELLIQQKYNITIPSLLFEYLAIENADFEVNDLKTFYSKFGEVIDFAIKGKMSIVLYNTFFAAECCREFLFNENNFKENMKQNFSVRWFDHEKDMGYLPPEMENVFESIHNRNICNIKDNNNNNKMINIINTKKNRLNNSNNGNNMNNLNQNQINLNGNQNSNNLFMSPNMMMKYNQMKINQNMPMNNMNNINNMQQNMHSMPNFGGITNILMPPPMNMPLFMNQNMAGMNTIMGMQMNNHQYNQNQKQFNQNLEEKNYGKYTCKYEILIPNDKDFQVARRLIGSKGCNMKKILNECKQNNNLNDNIKLRLRGRGSGYKEGPQNKESDEPLHLCISAKNQEEMKKACGLVDELLNKIYDEYKKYCIKNNIAPVAPQLANRIDCGNSLHKAK
mgnify:CR=1 FL=1|jgi:hypothetical protein